MARTGFIAMTDATLPTGALDNDWYKVSTGGYYKGKTTVAGQYVKLIDSLNDLIVVGDPSPPAVQYVPQALTSAEQTQARANISATSVADVLIFG